MHVHVRVYTYRQRVRPSFKYLKAGDLCLQMYATIVMVHANISLMMTNWLQDALLNAKCKPAPCMVI